MSDLEDKLFFLYCCEEITPPPGFAGYAPLREFYDSLPQDQKRRLFNAMDGYEWEFAQYSHACFEQGMRFAFSLARRLYADGAQ